MRNKFCATVLRWLGWKHNLKIEMPDKCILCVAPHTSNWDLILGEFMYFAIGNKRKAHFLIKKEWFRFPLNYLFDRIGGIAVDRGRSNSLVGQIVKEFKSRDYLRLAITPEGTRKANPRWKRGFYHIAKQAGVPIALVYLDYGKKQAGIERLFVPTDDEEADIREIKNYFAQFSGKHPENFAI